MEIRFADPDDARGIATVHVHAWRAAYKGIVPDPVLDRLSVEERERAWRGILRDTDRATFTLVATVAQRPVEGFCSATAPSRDGDATDGTAEVTATYVDPDRWRRGIGRALFGEALVELRSRGKFHELTLWVFKANDRARAFYESFGLVADGAGKTHEASGQAVIRMRTALPGVP